MAILKNENETITPRLKNVRFGVDTMTVGLADGRSIIAPLAWFPRLQKATPKQRQNWKPAAAGQGIHWPDIDEDLSIEGLLRGNQAPKP